MALTIAIDFDDTFTAAPELWEKFIRQAQQAGHNIICVTSRRDTDANYELLQRAFSQFHLTVPIIFCNLKSKLDVIHNQGVKVDIWIDDDPIALVDGH